MYSTVLEKKFRDVLAMLDYCYRSGRDEISVNELAAFLGVGQQKVLSLIEILNDEMNELEDKTFVFKLRSNFYVYFSFSRDYSDSHIYSSFLRKSINYIFLQELFLGKYQSPQKFAIDNHMCTKTLSRKISASRALLKEYGINLNLKCHDPLQGPEYQIRYFYTMLNWQTYQEKPQEVRTWNRTGEEILTKFTQEFLPNIKLIEIREYQYALSTMIARINQGKVITELPDVCWSFSNLFFTYEEFFEGCFKPFMKAQNIFLPDGMEIEARFYYFYISTMIMYLPDELMTLDYGQLNIQNFDCDLSTRFIEKFSQYFNISLDQSTYLYLISNLSSVHNFSNVFCGSYVSFGKKNALDYFFHQFPQLYSEVRQFFLDKLKEEDFQKVYANNPRLIYQYCLIVRPIMEELAPPLRIAVVSKISKIQSEWQKQEIERHCGRPVIFVNEGEYLDLLITDFPAGKFVPFKGEPVLFTWEPIQTDTDWQRLRDVITALSFKKQKAKEKRSTTSITFKIMKTT